MGLMVKKRKKKLPLNTGVKKTKCGNMFIMWNSNYKVL